MTLFFFIDKDQGAVAQIPWSEPKRISGKNRGCCYLHCKISWRCGGNSIVFPLCSEKPD